MKNKIITLTDKDLAVVTSKVTRSESADALKDKNILVGAEFEFKVKWFGSSDWETSVLRFLQNPSIPLPFAKYKIAKGYRAVQLKPGDKHWGADYDASVGNQGFELKNPPMPLPEFIKICPKVFDYIDYNDGFTDNDCGFHVNMSIKGERNLKDKLNIVKLLAFLDEGFLKEKFSERLGSKYVQPVKDKLKKEGRLTPDDWNKFIDQGKLFKEFNKSHTEAVNIEHLKNTESGRVEFRYLGHANYHKQWPKMKYFIGYFAHLMKLAYDDNYKKKEFTLKLLRIIEKTKGPTDEHGNLQIKPEYLGAVNELLSSEEAEITEVKPSSFGYGQEIVLDDGYSYLVIEKEDAEELAEAKVKEDFKEYQDDPLSFKDSDYWKVEYINFDRLSEVVYENRIESNKEYAQELVQQDNGDDITKNELVEQMVDFGIIEYSEVEEGLEDGSFDPYNPSQDLIDEWAYKRASSDMEYWGEYEDEEAASIVLWDEDNRYFDMERYIENELENIMEHHVGSWHSDYTGVYIFEM